MSVKEYEGEFTPAATHDKPEPAARTYTYKEWKVEIFKLYPGSESRDRIAWCLEILYLLHHPDDPYEVEEMFDAGDWYLKGNTTAMASILPTGRQGGILPAPLPQSATAPVSAKTTDTSGADSGYVKREELSQIISDSLAQAIERLSKPSGTNTGRPLLLKDLCHFCGQIGHTMVKGRCLELENYIRAGKCRKNRDNKVVLPSGSYIPQYPKKLYYKDRLEKWHCLNPSNLATENLSANAAPDAQQQQAMNNMQAPAAATLVHEIVQEPRVDQYVLTTNKRIEYHQQELLKLQMLWHGNKRQVADGVQVPAPKQPLTDYHPVDTPKSSPSASTEASSSQRKEPKAAEEKLLPKDKGKKLMKPTVEEVPEESLPPIHPYSGIPEI
ncbi:hypothetical protein C0995_010854 [Termitomyces sp. Mi166|nr:hypothetical protein C0995_010854 [Termitomyces sp. Mi166\